jgi:hypothetical protein
VQSYDILLNVVSFAYGKYAIRQKMKVTGNQLVSETETECPMENYTKGKLSETKKAAMLMVLV